MNHYLKKVTTCTYSPVFHRCSNCYLSSLTDHGGTVLASSARVRPVQSVQTHQHYPSGKALRRLPVSSPVTVTIATYSPSVLVEAHTSSPAPPLHRPRLAPLPHISPTTALAGLALTTATAPVHVELAPRRREAETGSGPRRCAGSCGGEVRPGHGDGVVGAQVLEAA